MYSVLELGTTFLFLSLTRKEVLDAHIEWFRKCIGSFNCFCQYTVQSDGGVELLQWECKSQAVELFVLAPLVSEQSVMGFSFGSCFCETEYDVL